jgi:dienelactone hydrolase
LDLTLVLGFEERDGDEDDRKRVNRENALCTNGAHYNAAAAALANGRTSEFLNQQLR